MNKWICLLAVIVLSFWSAEAQNFYDIRLKTHSINCETNEVCYDVQIKSGTDRLWRYAGQNYRMLYNGTLAEFESVEQVLAEPLCASYVVQDLQHLDLSDEGNLIFDEDISWLNYFIDMNTALQGTLLSPDVWTTTSRVCFSTLVDVMDDPDLCFEMVWAREELTFQYATAFVEVSEWLDINHTSDQVFGENYVDLNSQSGDEACFNLTCDDNPPSYHARIVLKSTDAENEIYCYGIELKSASGRQWTLHDQVFAFFFDGSHASFESAVGSLPGYGPAIIEEVVENQEVSGTGSLSFEDNMRPL